MNNDTDMGNEKKAGAYKVLLFIPDWDMKRKMREEITKEKFRQLSNFRNDSF